MTCLKFVDTALLFFHVSCQGLIVSCQGLIDCARKNVLPSSLRLLDNFHVNFGLALRFNSSFLGEILDTLKKAALISIMGFSEESYSMATYLVEGEKQAVDQQEGALISIAKNHGGIKTGEKYGKRGYLMTFTVGYSRVRRFSSRNLTEEKIH